MKNIAKYFLFLLIGLFIGIIITYLVYPKKIKNNIVKTNDTKFKALYETYESLKENYYVDVDDKTLINGAIRGMMESLDDKHSMFFDKEEKKEFENELSGTYYGIGAEIKEINDGQVMINKVFDDSPAQKAGLKSGDIFISIDGKETTGLTATEIAKNLRSEKKENATIVIKRGEEELTIKVLKDNVNLLSVSSEMLDDNIGYIAVSIFGEKTYSQFNEALDSLEKNDMKALIIDLRENSGGYLSTVTYMLNEFLDTSKTLYQMKTRSGIEKFSSLDNKSKNYKPRNTK